MNNTRLESLLHRYFDELLKRDERIELESLLLNDSVAREQFWEMARCNALIRHWGEMECGCREAADMRGRPLPVVRQNNESVADKLRQLWRWWILVSATAFAAIILIAGFAWHRFSGLAKVTRLYHVQWASNGEELHSGQILNRGWLHLEAGAVEIEFSRGARVVLQGPAELRIVSRNEAFLRSGKINAIVPPPAHGFKLATPDFNVVDHGTRFGCILAASGLAEVHVFAGSVSWEPRRREFAGRELKADDALKISGLQVQSIPANPGLFLFEDNLMQETWKNESHWLQENPSGLVYFNFDNTNETSLIPNLARNADAGSEAKMIGCKFVPGRFPGERSVEFNNPNDRLRLTVPGKYDALTFLAWVRLDALPANQASLAMTESFTMGEVHWFIHYNGCFGLGIHTKLPNDANGWEFVETPPGVLSTNLGSWIMLASTFDRNTGKMTDYLNGKPIASGKIVTAHMPLHLDTFEIGNWGVPANDPRLTRPRRGHPGDTVRNFNGCIDEFSILATALRPEDIQWLYSEGRPMAADSRGD
ncbi:MAG TPA: LamG-like jellyroll fold domain-containing protein [Verrucomicrobiae bacterium]|nr:LamG-like jellyroll fold domain-containing protein [Verrucomicrobiae bacterium]